MYKFLLEVIFFSLTQYLNWYVNPLFSIISLLPLIKILNEDEKNTIIILKIFLLLTLSNLIVTYWLIKIDNLKGTLSILSNSIIFTLIGILYRLLKTKTESYQNTLLLLLSWLSLEYFHNTWDFNWPWLTLGNTFGQNPNFVLWYQYTGVLGGSLWIFLINFAIYKFFYYRKFNLSYFLRIVFIFILPLSFSLLLLKQSTKFKKPENKINVTVVHSNYNSNSTISDIDKVDASIALLNKYDTKNSTIILYPELFLNNGTWIDGFENNNVLRRYRKYLLEKPNNSFIVGGLFYKENLKGTEFKKDNRNFLVSMNKYNGAIEIDTSIKINFKAKKIYIPIVEYVPEYLKKFSFNSDNYSCMPNNINSFRIKNKTAFISICYESINSIFIADNWNEENYILMLASEAFFNKSKIGMNQYLNICRIRAIETQKYIFKSSNCGYSAVINEKGAIEDYYYTESKDLKILRFSGFSNETRSFYTTSKGLFNKIIVFFFIIILLISIVKKIK